MLFRILVAAGVGMCLGAGCDQPQPATVPPDTIAYRTEQARRIQQIEKMIQDEEAFNAELRKEGIQRDSRSRYAAELAIARGPVYFDDAWAMQPGRVGYLASARVVRVLDKNKMLVDVGGVQLRMTGIATGAVVDGHKLELGNPIHITGTTSHDGRKIFTAEPISEAYLGGSTSQPTR